MLNFWASWCPPCADEAPDLNALSVRYGSLGVRFVGVDFNDAVDEARAFAKRHDVPYALVHDTRGVRQAFGVSAPPETYVIDGSGRAVVRIEGPVDTPLLEPYMRIAVARSGRAAPLDPDVEVGGKTLSSLRGSPLLVAFVTPDCASCATLMQRLSALGGHGARDRALRGRRGRGHRRRPAGHERPRRRPGATRPRSHLLPDAARDRRARAARGRADRRCPGPAALSRALQRAEAS